MSYLTFGKGQDLILGHGMAQNKNLWLENGWVKELSKIRRVHIFDFPGHGDNLNMENWSYEEGDGCPNLCGWGNNERQIYHKDCVEVKDGMLIITADKEGDNYYSGKINSKDKFEKYYQHYSECFEGLENLVDTYESRKQKT